MSSLVSWILTASAKKARMFSAAVFHSHLSGLPSRWRTHRPCNHERASKSIEDDRQRLVGQNNLGWFSSIVVELGPARLPVGWNCKVKELNQVVAIV